MKAWYIAGYLVLFAVVFLTASHFIGKQHSAVLLPNHSEGHAALSAGQDDAQTDGGSWHSTIFPPILGEADEILAANAPELLADVLPVSDFWWLDDGVQAELAELGYAVENPAAGYIRFATDLLLSLTEHDQVEFVLPQHPEVVVRAEVTSMETLQTGAIELLLHNDQHQLVASMIVLTDQTIDGVLYLEHETFALFAVQGVGWLMNANAMFPAMDGFNEDF